MCTSSIVTTFLALRKKPVQTPILRYMPALRRHQDQRLLSNESYIQEIKR
jgi:hypothetical protein